jgi:hypothetical protein
MKRALRFCPACRMDGRPACEWLKVDDDSGIYRCSKCGATGHVFVSQGDA